MRSVFIYGLGFGFLGIIAGGAVGLVVSNGPWGIVVFIVLAITCLAALFGAIVGLAATVDDLAESLADIRDRLESGAYDRHRPSRFGETTLPRFNEEPPTGSKGEGFSTPLPNEP